MCVSRHSCPNALPSSLRLDGAYLFGGGEKGCTGQREGWWSGGPQPADAAGGRTHLPPRRWRAGLSGKLKAHSPAITPPPPTPLQGQEAKSTHAETLACLPPGIIQSPWRPVALSSGWADRLEMGKEGKHEEGGGGGDMEKSEQGLKNEEINLPGGRQPRSVLHKAVLGPPRTLAGGGGRRWLLLGPLPLPLSWAPAPTW